jgi:hypothetical protein
MLLLLCVVCLGAGALAQQKKQDPKAPKQGTAGYSDDVTDVTDGDSLIHPPQTVTRNIERVPLPAGLQELVTKQFGKEFQIRTELPAPFITGDFDADGVEDIAIVVGAHHPLSHGAEFGFVAFSPEDEYYGYGDPKIMTNTEWERWEDRKFILVIHGAGAEAWRNDHPKGKYLLVNLPFDHIYVVRTKIKKKLQDAIGGESSVMSSVVYWTGKKYKYDPTSAVE